MSLTDAIERKKHEHGDKFDSTDIDNAHWSIRFAYSPNRIVRVKLQDGTTGYVGMTTGWKPAFLLVDNTRSLGSSRLIGPDDRVVEYKHRKQDGQLERRWRKV